MPSRHGELRCPNGCDLDRFEALNAPLYVNAQRHYLEHDDRQATFVCAQCQAIAVDIATVAEAMRRDAEAEPQVLVCPHCQTEMLPPSEDELAPFVECPICETRFAIEEGMPHLHGGQGWAGAE